MKLPVALLLAFSLSAGDAVAQTDGPRADYDTTLGQATGSAPHFVVGVRPASGPWSVLSISLTGVNLSIKRERPDGPEQWASAATCPGLETAVANFEQVFVDMRSTKPKPIPAAPAQSGDVYQASIMQFPIGAHPFQTSEDFGDDGKLGATPLSTWTTGLLMTADSCWQSGADHPSAPKRKKRTRRRRHR